MTGSLGEVGHCGVASRLLRRHDHVPLFADIPLGDVTTSMTISGPAVPIFHVPRAADARASTQRFLIGTLQTDIFKEYIAQRNGCSHHLSRICG